MRICGILKIAAVLSADFILLYLGFGVIAAGVITEAFSFMDGLVNISLSYRKKEFRGIS